MNVLYLSSPMGLLSPGNVASATEDLNFNPINFKLNSHKS